LLEAFKLAFDNSPEVELIIKADYFLDPENKKQQCIQLINEFGMTNVKLIWGELTTVQLFELYNFADVYVTATKAEGWGLPMIEAAATGLPIIAPFYSGHTEFLKHIESSVLKVKFDHGKIDDPEFMRYWPVVDGNYGSWAQVDVHDLKGKLIDAKNTFQALDRLAIENGSTLRINFNWSSSSTLAMDSLKSNNILNID
jgi:glycosyltransferase involved in cell wall biosynthesis